MLFIVTAHMMYHGVLYDLLPKNLGTTYIFAQWLTLGGKMGVGIFVMITGYFNINKIKWNFSGLIKLWGQTFFLFGNSIFSFLATEC